MRKMTFFVCVLTQLALTLAASADYTVLNGGKYKVSLIVSTWMEQDGDTPAGYRTDGYYTIDPGNFFTIDWGSSDYYLRMHKWVDGDRKLIKPSDSATRDTYKFWTEPKNAFTIVEEAKGEILYGSGGMENLARIGGFYKYQNGGTFKINGDNLETAKLTKVNSELGEKKRELAEVNQQLGHPRSTITQIGLTGYTVLNGSTHDVQLIVSTWMDSTGDIPAGYRTRGYYKIEPGNFRTIDWGSSDYYLRMHRWVDGDRKLIKPREAATRGTYTFWVEPKNAFTVVENGSGKILYGSDGLGNLIRTGNFYKYGNIGTFTIRGPHLELAEKEFELSEINRKLLYRQLELVFQNHKSGEFGPQEIHALLILIGNDKDIRASVKQNEGYMKDLLRQVSQHANVHLTVMTSEDEVTGKVTTMTLSAGNIGQIKSVPQGLIKGHQVNDWLNNLRVGEHDTILIYYSGHGAMRGSDDKQVLNFDQQTKDKVLRSDLRVQLEGKQGRLKMLITDTCSHRSGTPELMAKSINFASIRQLRTAYIKNLFLQHKGILDITAVEPGHYAWGSTDIGGFFTVALLQSFTVESDANDDRFLTWEEVFENAQLKTDAFFKQIVRINNVDQKAQKPVGHSFPARVD